MTANFTQCLCLEHYSKAQLRNLESEIELVSKVQKDLLPCKVPGLQGIEMAARTESAGIVGDDYYDFYNLPKWSKPKPGLSNGSARPDRLSG
ncbi:hypothetical protein IID10_09770 [candidate division KSB1 bacterium]|nr:hypothetical protein [candidate division KSB1 bacterium]